MYGAFDVVLYYVIIQLFWLLINLLLILSYLIVAAARSWSCDVAMVVFQCSGFSAAISKPVPIVGFLQSSISDKLPQSVIHFLIALEANISSDTHQLQCIELHY